MDLSVYSFIQNPLYQAVLFLLLTPLIVFLIKPKTADKAWVLAAYTFMGFLIVNAVLIWFDENPWRYFFYSIGVALAYLLVIAIIMQGLIKVLNLRGSGESGMAFLIMIYQPFALLFVMFVKWIIHVISS
jgi:hypothetical protein